MRSATNQHKTYPAAAASDPVCPRGHRSTAMSAAAIVITPDASHPAWCAALALCPIEEPRSSLRPLQLTEEALHPRSDALRIVFD